MTFFEFYSNHFVPLTVVFSLLIMGIVIILLLVFRRLKGKGVKTPWFEVASDSVKIPESEASGKTRLLISRQLVYIENYVNGLEPVFLNVTKNLVDDALETSYSLDNVARPRYHLITKFIQTTTNELSQSMINYLGHLLIVNHIGTDKDKIRKYVKGHVNQVMSIVKKDLSDVYCDLSGQVCLDIGKYWKMAGVDNPTEFVSQKLYDLLINISYLRYSDFDNTNDNDSDNDNNKK